MEERSQPRRNSILGIGNSMVISRGRKEHSRFQNQPEAKVGRERGGQESGFYFTCNGKLW